MIARVLKKKEEARAVFFILYATTKRLGSLSRARARGFHRLRAASFFSYVIFVSFKVGYAKSEFGETRARALKARDLFPRTTMRRRKRTYLNLGGLEAGDGRDLLSSSKHYVFSKVDVFLCV